MGLITKKRQKIKNEEDALFGHPLYSLKIDIEYDHGSL